MLRCSYRLIYKHLHSDVPKISCGELFSVNNKTPFPGAYAPVLPFVSPSSGETFCRLWAQIYVKQVSGRDAIHVRLWRYLAPPTGIFMGRPVPPKGRREIDEIGINIISVPKTGELPRYSVTRAYEEIWRNRFCRTLLEYYMRCCREVPLLHCFFWSESLQLCYDLTKKFSFVINFMLPVGLEFP